MSNDNTIDFVAGVMAERMAALLFIVGGPDMERLGYVTFGASGGWYLTQKGQQVFHATLARLPACQPLVAET